MKISILMEDINTPFSPTLNKLNKDSNCNKKNKAERMLVSDKRAQVSGKTKAFCYSCHLFLKYFSILAYATIYW